MVGLLVGLVGKRGMEEIRRPYAHTHSHLNYIKKYKIGIHRNNLQVERYLMAGLVGGR